MKRVNNIFGEGISPKLRMTRHGLSLIGVPQDLVLRHDCPRLVYGVRLAKNAYASSGQTDAPDYAFSPSKSEEGTKAIIRHWLTRWFLARARRTESLQKRERFRPDDIRLSREIPEAGGEATQEEKTHVPIG